MAVGKYSPTVNEWYRKDQEWYRKNCSDPFSFYDKDGYDSYGYNAEGKDRAGYTEFDYLCESTFNEDSDTFSYYLYEDVYFRWQESTPVFMGN